MSLLAYLIEQLRAGHEVGSCLNCLARAAADDPAVIRTEIANIGQTLAVDARNDVCARCGRYTLVYGFRHRSS
jgi:hypothetical protein